MSCVKIARYLIAFAGNVLVKKSLCLEKEGVYEGETKNFREMLGIEVCEYGKKVYNKTKNKYVSYRKNCITKYYK